MIYVFLMHNSRILVTTNSEEEEIRRSNFGRCFVNLVLCQDVHD